MTYPRSQDENNDSQQPQLDATQLLERYAQLRSERQAWERCWSELAHYCLPTRTRFSATSTNSPQAPQSAKADVYDATAMQAAENLAATLNGLLARPDSDWFSLAPNDAQLAQDPEVKAWFTKVSAILRYRLHAAGKGFYAQLPDFFRDLVVFGTAYFTCQARFAPDSGAFQGLHFSARPLSELYVAVDDWGQISALYRPFTLSRKQALARYGDFLSDKPNSDALNDGLIESHKDAYYNARYDEQAQAQPLSFVQVFIPNPNAKDNALFAQHKPWLALVLYQGSSHARIIHQAGYDELPYQVTRWAMSAGAAYGSSQAMLALPDIRMLNAMAKTTLIAAQLAIDPPILTQQELSIQGIKTTPGAIIAGGLDPSGKRLFEPFATGANVGLGLEMEQQRRQMIQQAFLHSAIVQLDQATSGNSSPMTATEYLGRQSEKARLLSAYVARIQSEFLDPLLRRAFALLYRAGQLPPAPKALGTPSSLHISYINPLARAHEMSEARAVMQSMGSIAPLLEYEPALIKAFDLNKAARLIAQAHGVPQDLFTPETVAAPS